MQLPDRPDRCCYYYSEVKASRTVKAIVVAVVAVVLVSAAANLIGGGMTTATMWAAIIGLLIVVVLLALAQSVAVVVQVKDEMISLSCMRFFRASFPVKDVTAVEDGSKFFAGGYGYRIIGPNHRGFIMGGPQVTMQLKDGRFYTASVPSVEGFRTATMKAH